ncbi:MAG TPA: 1-deoxy-D-xylulose-5-phosphate reductoisomerase [Negativicutes bacterium]|nr:1-deoxy-D-xylulose-5-phosphate reductoisomerase [Negativicutes bacterium]
MINVAILGSTGSIGTQTLDVIAANPDLFRLCALAAHSNHRLLREQIAIFRPDFAVLTDVTAGKQFVAEGIPEGLEFQIGEAALLKAAAYADANVVLNALVGFAGLAPSIASINAGKTLAIANKETLVAAGALVMKLAAEKKVAVVPVDSEHSAIAQCLAGEGALGVKRLLITASGGPFRGRKMKDLTKVSLHECLKHPNWTMGRKITIDSATLMNKGLEVIEAHWLFDVEYDRIDVVVHPQSIVHSMVEFVDGSIKAQLGLPDMKLPIQYALNQGIRIDTAFTRIDFSQALSLTFEPPDTDTFRALPLAYEAGRRGSTFPCVMNAANEVGVQAFIDKKIGFADMIHVVEEVLMKHTGAVNPVLDDYMDADAWARRAANEFVDKVVK